jgi:hypothetical protein
VSRWRPGLVDWRVVTAVPRSAGDDADRRTQAALAAAIVAAHAASTEGVRSGGARGSLALAWLRRPAEARIRLLVGGTPTSPVGPPAGPVLWPPGALSEPAGADEVAEWWDEHPSWIRCAGGDQVPPWAGPRGEAAGTPLDAVADWEHVVHLGRPFAWAVVAEPVTPDRLEAEIVRVRTRLGLLRAQATSESHQVDLERGRRRFRELVTARAGGLWEVHVLAGGPSPGDARLTASLLSRAVSAQPSPLVLVPDSRPGPLDEVWQRAVTGPDGTTSPFTAGDETVARLAPPPVREVPGVRSLVPPRFDLTPETPGDVVLGRVIDETFRDVGPFGVTPEAVNRHVFVCGATGSGKSQTTRQLLESLARARPPVPWLVLEPVKAEYAAMSGRLSDRGDSGPVLVVRPGDLTAAPASLNPLEPEPGYPLQSHVDLVRALFLAAFQATEPFPQVLGRALTDCYTEAGWDLVTGRLRRPVRPKLLTSEDDRPVRARFPTLGDLQSTARRVVDAIGYGPEVTADVRGFVDVRMGSLRQGAPGRFFEGGHPLDVGGLLARHAVLELESVTNDQDQAFLIGTVVIRLVEHLRVHRRAAGGLRHVLVVEEAHRLLRHATGGPAAAAVEFFAGLLAEIRAYGEGVVVVEQIPSKVIPDVVKNTAVKVMHRLPARDDRDARRDGTGVSCRVRHRTAAGRPAKPAVRRRLPGTALHAGRDRRSRRGVR